MSCSSAFRRYKAFMINGHVKKTPCSFHCPKWAGCVIIGVMGKEDFKSEEEYVSQAGTGALLNPRVDSTFKAMLTQVTEESRAAMKSFLEAATERVIKMWKLTANEPPEEFAGQRGVSYDIACEFDDGSAADVEMQAFNQEYDYGKRAEYQVARLETTYLKRGDDWEEAPTVYQISVLNFNYESGGADGTPRKAQ